MASGSKSPRLCIVDHDDANRDSLRVLLESYLYAVADFATPFALLEANDIFTFDCFVIDHDLPGMTGLELLEVLRSRRVPTPAVLTCSDARLVTAERLAKVGSAAVLQKPLQLNLLLDCIKDFIRNGP